MIKKDMDASTNTQSLAEAALELEETTIEEEATIDETVKEEAAALVF
jgi:hypothetical protein